MDKQMDGWLDGWMLEQNIKAQCDLTAGEADQCIRAKICKWLLSQLIKLV